MEQSQALSSRKFIGIFAMLILFWTLSWTIGKIGIAHIPPLHFAALRLIIGTPCMFLISALTGNFKIPQRRDLPLIFSIGILQISLFLIFISFGLSHVPANRSAILVYTTPLWAIPAAILLFKEKFSRNQGIGLLFGAVGILLLFNPLLVNWQDPRVFWGNLSLLGASLCWAMAILCARFCQWHSSTLSLAPWQMLVGTFFTITAAVFFEVEPKITWGWVGLSSLFYNAIFSTTLAFWGSIVISKYLPVSISSLSLLMVPMLNIGASWLILGEPVTWHMLVAMLSIGIGIIYLFK